MASCCVGFTGVGDGVGVCAMIAAVKHRSENRITLKLLLIILFNIKIKAPSNKTRACACGCKDITLKVTRLLRKVCVSSFKNNHGSAHEL